MTETAVQYLISTNHNVLCPQCGRIVGKYARQSDGRVYFRIGALVVYAAHGFCECGAAFHFSASDQALERLLARRDRLAQMASDIAKIVDNGGE